MGVDTLPIEKSVELNLKYPSVSDRYFSHYFFMPINPYKKTYIRPGDDSSKVSDKEGERISSPVSSESRIGSIGEDTRILMHSNKICVVTLAPNHPIIMNKKIISKINFNVSGIDRLSNKVSGKGKRGAQIVGLFSPLCSLHCKDDSVYTVYTGMRGKLIEVNERLIENPNLICEFPEAEGYLAVVLPKLKKNDDIKKFLLTREEYESIYHQNSV